MTEQQRITRRAWLSTPTGRAYLRKKKARYRHTHPARSARDYTRRHARARTTKNAYKARFPDRTRTHKLVAAALRSGSLTRLPCSICSAPNALAHHLDYTQPLLVSWLCPHHHRLLHTLPLPL